MKKKLLSLMMAATLVATGSVSAFATNQATGSNTIGGDSVDATGAVNEYQSEVKITGDIADDKGNYKPGTISVTVPTAAAFQVDNNGTFIGANLEVVNNGTDLVEVLVDEFIDTNKEVGISVIARTDIDPNPISIARNNISLSIKGNRDVAYLKTQTNINPGSGVYSDPELVAEVNDGHKIAEIQPSKSETLVLEGTAGTQPDSVPSPIKDDFTLKLKVRKVQP